MKKSILFILLLFTVIISVACKQEMLDKVTNGVPNSLSNSYRVADAYDALTSERPYRKGYSNKEAIAELKRCSGTQFDPEVVDILINQVLTEIKNNI